MALTVARSFDVASRALHVGRDVRHDIAFTGVERWRNRRPGIDTLMEQMEDRRGIRGKEAASERLAIRFVHRNKDRWRRAPERAV